MASVKKRHCILHQRLREKEFFQTQINKIMYYNDYFFPKQITATEGASLSDGVLCLVFSVVFLPHSSGSRKLRDSREKAEEGERWRDRGTGAFLKIPQSFGEKFANSY
jgi:hypothetical protein